MCSISNRGKEFKKGTGVNLVHEYYKRVEERNEIENLKQNLSVRSKKRFPLFLPYCVSIFKGVKRHQITGDLLNNKYIYLKVNETIFCA